MMAMKTVAKRKSEWIPLDQNDWLSIAFWRICHPKGGPSSRIDLDVLGARLNRSPRAIRYWLRNGVTKFHLLKKLQDLTGVDLRLIGNRGIELRELRAKARPARRRAAA